MQECLSTGALTSWEGGVTNEVVALACIASITSSMPTSFFAVPARLLKACTQHEVHVTALAGLGRRLIQMRLTMCSMQPLTATLECKPSGQPLLEHKC